MKIYFAGSIRGGRDDQDLYFSIIKELQSLGVGYELGQAESMGKRIICLYRNTEGKRLSAMSAGNTYMEIHSYSSLEDVKKILCTL